MIRRPPRSTRTDTLFPYTTLLTKQMSDEFAKLFLDGGAQSLPPLTALALYYDYRELTPPGPEGDEIISKLADRLVSVDLLNRAAELIEHRSEERRVGKEVVSTCRSRWAPYH